MPPPFSDGGRGVGVGGAIHSGLSVVRGYSRDAARKVNPFLVIFFTKSPAGRRGGPDDRDIGAATGLILTVCTNLRLTAPGTFM
jgi:hypothetical protein